MRAVLDACVLFPTVLRELLIGMAEQGTFTPLWSERILAEWGHAVRKRLGPEAGLQAQSEQVLLRQGWPDALVAADAQTEDRLWLPDAADQHVLATAITGRAEVIVTFNLRDFPPRVLAQHGLGRTGPDAFLTDLALRCPQEMDRVARVILKRACDIGGERADMAALLKKARLPRLARLLRNS